MINVTDTHSLVWFISGNERLSQPARDALADKTAAIVVPPIVLGEVFHLHNRGRIQVSLEEVLDYVNRAMNCSIYAFDAAVARLMPAELEMHDGMIVATAVLLAQSEQTVQLITRDEAVTASNLVPALW